MERPIVYPQEQLRSFDYLNGFRDYMKGSARLAQSLLGPNDPIVTRFSAAAKANPSLVIDLAAGDIMQWAPIDALPYGGLSADNEYIYQQGYAAAREIEFSTAQLAAGQSYYALIRARFKQSDVVRTGDPNGGVLPYFNSSNPLIPQMGPNSNGGMQATVRLGLAEIDVIYGNPAPTGSEIAPVPGGGWVPLYLIKLTFGQTTISNGQILEAPAGIVGYPKAPFWRGVRGQHHKGTDYGQAPQIDVTQEITGIVPLPHLPATNQAEGLLICTKSGVGDPNGVQAGQFLDEYYQTDADIVWKCKVAGDATHAEWVTGSNIGGELILGFPATITKSKGIFVAVLTADGVINLPPANKPRELEFIRGDSVTAARAILTPAGSDKFWKDDALANTIDLLIGEGRKIFTIPSQNRWYIN